MKAGYRYGVPEKQAQYMDLVYEGALRVIEKHARQERREQEQKHKIEEPAPRRKLVLRKRG